MFVGQHPTLNTQHPPAVPSALGLIVLGGLSCGLYGWIALRYPLLAGLAIGRASWATLGDRSLAAGLLHGGVYALLLLLYLLALRLLLGSQDSAHKRGPLLITLGGWLLASAILLAAYPGESLDIFDYLFRGRMLAEYGASPLAQSPTPFNDKPFHRLITWRGQVDTYGPLWEYASWGVAKIVGRSLPTPLAETTAALMRYVLGYRLLAIWVSGLCGALIYQIVRRSAPRLAAAALLAWLWNPLLLTVSAVGAHNDLIMLLWMLGGLWLFQRERWLLGLLALLLAAHVKLTALLLLPVAGLWLLRRVGWRRSLDYTAGALAIMAPLSWLLYAPLGGWATLPRMLRERTLFLANSLADLLYRWLQEQQGWVEPAARQLAILGATALFCVLAGLLLLLLLDLRTLLRPHAAPPADALLWRCSIAIFIAYLLVGSFWFMPWYALWALALAALLPASRWMRGWLPALCLGALWSGLAADVLTFLPGRPLSPTMVTWATLGCLLAPLASAGLMQIGLGIRWKQPRHRKGAHPTASR